MKVLLLTTHLNIGGVAVYTVNLAGALEKKGISVYVASGGGELTDSLKKNNIPHLRINVKTKFEFHPKLFFTFLRLLEFVKKNKVDVVHAQTRVTQVLAYLLSKFTPVAYVSTCHGFFKKERVSRKIFGAWGNHVIAISDAVKRHLITDLGVDEKHVFLIYNGVDAAAFSTIGAVEDEKDALRMKLGFKRSPVIGSISRLSPVKGFKYLLLAMKDVLGEIPEAKLLLVGEGPSKAYLMRLAENLGIMPSVFFALNTTQTQRFLSIIDVFVFYSLEEGLGLSLLEAMAAGKPCIASDVGGVSSVVENDVTGILVPPRDTHALKEAIIRVFGDNELRVLLAKKGRALVEKKFSLDGMTKGVIGVYGKACAK